MFSWTYPSCLVNLASVRVVLPVNKILGALSRDFLVENPPYAEPAFVGIDLGFLCCARSAGSFPGH